MGRRRLAPGTKCYACTSDATNWEHAPPKGFYPKPAETYRRRPGENFRKNLIEVPSCDAHNNPKAASDGYARGVIAVMAASYSGALNRESIDAHPFLRRQIEIVHRGRRLRDTFIDGASPLVSAPSYVALQIETDAVYEVVEAAARALYYHEHQHDRRWTGKCHIVSPHLRYSDLRVPEYRDAMVDVIEGFDSSSVQEELGAERKGPHPSIFYYQKIEHGSAIYMSLVFYGAFHFLAFRMSSDPPSHEASQQPEAETQGNLG